MAVRRAAGRQRRRLRSRPPQPWSSDKPNAKRVGPEEEGTPWLTIVGFVDDYRHYTLTEPMGPATYVPFGSNPRQQMTVVVKTSGPTAAMVPTLRRVMSELDPNVPAYRIEILEDEVARQTWVQRIARDILTAFAATAALLAVIGLDDRCGGWFSRMVQGR